MKSLFQKYVATEIRSMLVLATPIILAELGWTTMSIVDTMMVGRQANSAAAFGLTAA